MSFFLLTVDIGNTTSSFGLYRFPLKGKIPRPFRISSFPTARLKFILKNDRFFKNNLGITKRSGPTLYSVVSSVVPSVDSLLRKGISKISHPPPLFVTSKTPSKVKIRYKKPSEVGSDRIVNARAAVSLYARPVIVVDFGTATTFDCVSKNKEYLGGVIAPGPVISAEALYERTAKLPKVLLKRPAKILGRNTLESIESGIFHGYRGMVLEIVRQLKKKLGPRTLVLATGGQAEWILKGIKGIHKFIPDLTHLGLLRIWQDQRNQY